MARALGVRNWLVTPSINVRLHIVEGADIGILDHETGVWHQTGTVGSGNTVIAGHRFKYLPPNRTTFYNLDLLKVGERMTLWWERQRHNYAITKSSTVTRDAIEILNPTMTVQLTLYTCTDLAASNRLVIVAQPMTNCCPLRSAEPSKWPALFFKDKGGV